MLRASLLANAEILPQARQGSYFFNRIGQKQPVDSSDFGLHRGSRLSPIASHTKNAQKLLLALSPLGNPEKQSKMSVNWAELIPTTGHAIVFEDEPVVRMLLEETLAEIGFSSATLDNAASALSHLISIKGDCTLIIADQGLPRGIQGSEFIRLANEQWPSIPSILTSGYLIDEQVIPPSTICLHKPYTLDQLETAIATALQMQCHSRNFII